MTEAYVVNVVSNLKTKYKIDKVFLMGFSQGAFFTYRIGITYHDLFDGLIVFGGELQTDALSKEDIAAGADIPVFIAHGNEDKIVPFQNGLDARDTLDAAGYDVTWHEFTGGHAVPADALQAAQAWMKTK
jgi:phospholipase/carboxylesterase